MLAVAAAIPITMSIPYTIMATYLLVTGHMWLDEETGGTKPPLVVAENTLFTHPYGFAITSLGMLPLWLLSLKIGAALADDAVIEVIKNAAEPSSIASDEEWQAKVGNPTRLLVKTMERLSNGWGKGIGVGALALWIWAFSRFSEFLLEYHKLALGQGTGEYTAASAFVRKLLPGVVYAIAPLLLVLDLATVSTMCDELFSPINAIGLQPMQAGEDATIHARTQPPMITLSLLNNNQGLGFKTFGVVVDKKTLNKLAFGVLSAFATIIPIMIALQPPPSSDDEAADAEQQGVGMNTSAACAGCCD